MLISNGIVNRNINPAKLPEYAAKGYKEVKADKPNKTDEGKGKGNKADKPNKTDEGNKD